MFAKGRKVSAIRWITVSQAVCNLVPLRCNACVRWTRERLKNSHSKGKRRLRNKSTTSVGDHFYSFKRVFYGPTFSDLIKFALDGNVPSKTWIHFDGIHRAPRVFSDKNCRFAALDAFSESRRGRTESQQRSAARRGISDCVKFGTR